MSAYSFGEWQPDKEAQDATLEALNGTAARARAVAEAERAALDACLAEHNAETAFQAALHSEETSGNDVIEAENAVHVATKARRAAVSALARAKGGE